MLNFREEKNPSILGVLFLNSKWNFLFDIYDPISKINYPSLMRVFLNLINVQFKEGNYLIDSIDISIRMVITTHRWCSSHSTSINACKVWGASQSSSFYEIASHTYTLRLG